MDIKKIAAQLMYDALEVRTISHKEFIGSAIERYQTNGTQDQPDKSIKAQTATPAPAPDKSSQ